MVKLRAFKRNSDLTQLVTLTQIWQQQHKNIFTNGTSKLNCKQRIKIQTDQSVTSKQVLCNALKLKQCNITQHFEIPSNDSPTWKSHSPIKLKLFNYSCVSNLIYVWKKNAYLFVIPVQSKPFKTNHSDTRPSMESEMRLSEFPADRPASRVIQVSFRIGP